MALLKDLFAGPIDIAGDVHGEVAALSSLLSKLGYDEGEHHVDGRRLVFLGDLTDRGPDSPAVLRKVMSLVEQSHAQCILGNHELILLRGVRRQGNDWWFGDSPEGTPVAAVVDPSDRVRFEAFLKTLPLALERDDLRVVHACWWPEAIEAIRQGDSSVRALYEERVAAFEHRWSEPEQARELAREVSGIDLRDREAQPPFLPLHASRDAEQQMANPVTVLTSGREAPTTRPFWPGGRWRMVEPVKWWSEYDDPVPVIVGHYWRRYLPGTQLSTDKHGPDLFADVAPHAWFGRRSDVYRVDFSVGARSELRRCGADTQSCQLAAIRLPEWQVVHDDGDTWSIGQPGHEGQGAST